MIDEAKLAEQAERAERRAAAVAYGSAWQRANRERVNANHRAWEERNREKVRKVKRESMRRARAKNPALYAERSKAWKAAHPDRVREHRDREAVVRAARAQLPRLVAAAVQRFGRTPESRAYLLELQRWGWSRQRDAEAAEIEAARRGGSVEADDDLRAMGLVLAGDEED